LILQGFSGTLLDVDTIVFVTFFAWGLYMAITRDSR